MAETLYRYRWLAPWIGMAAAVLLNVFYSGQWSSSIQAHQFDLERRILIIEGDNKDHEKRINESSSRLARIETGIEFIKQAIESKK